ncbi:zinc/manganese transport system permease protein [Corynebacterium freneyi]|uniref:Zinc/manganese transport system permease protein n=2 Tax=Corynebacterium freneyi TaxID=134034 RepID=A0ABS4U624_9CORY|nr:metal ABC transporter permease [Corynebacterium freneyi]MBP2331646.1 zinc/manganese transport system permease protein [Corynebacterium freneyi]QXA51896.1 metal ABC transporter permease [Corynebacterium freneyi]
MNTFVADTQTLLNVGFVQSALIAAALLGLVSGVITPLVVMRQMSFTVHGTSELALMGASAALLAGVSVGGGAIVGSVLAAVVLALLGMRGGQDAIVGVVLSFGMGLSVLFIHLYPGRTTTAFALLTGQIVGLSSASVWLLAGVAALVITVVALFWRPLLFASADPVMAAASGINVRAMSVLFAVLIGLTAAQGVQIVGALLIISLVITPGAAAAYVTASPVKAVVLSVIFAEVAAVGGVILSLAPGMPVSVFVTTISFVIYLVCRFLGWYRGRAATRDEVSAGRWASPPTAPTAPTGSAAPAIPDGPTGGPLDDHPDWAGRHPAP